MKFYQNKMKFYQNKKNGKTYKLLCNSVRDATNATDGRIMVLYESVETGQKFVRETKEFDEKFTLITTII